MNSAHIEDLPSDPEDTIDRYDVATREGTQPERAPKEDYIGQQLSRFSNKAGHAMARFRLGCRRMARKLNCMASHDEVFVGGATGSGVAGEQAAVEDSEDDSEADNESVDSEEADPTFDIIGSSQLPDAPSPTQPTQTTPQKRCARRRDRFDVGSGNVLPTAPGRPRRKKKTWTPNPIPGGGGGEEEESE
ncbi:unnamed protein product [Urochloa decumbens]|uniref:Uncharacterized protein n=1 Tax=Urochloa decumbens TaxID=240449 RepID=A0ABC9D6Q1_9POAL